MALFTTDFFMAKTLSRGFSINVFLPDSILQSKNMAGTYPTIWLLHNIGGNHADWSRFTMAEALTGRAGFACIMPSIDFSFCANIDSGRYEDFLAEELYRYCCTMYPISTHREAHFLLGYGLGGYAAMRLALARPDRYVGACSINGANIAQLFPSIPDVEQENQCALSLPPLNQATLCGSQFDLYYLAQSIVSGGLPRPRLWGYSSKDSETADQMKKDALFLQEAGLHYELQQVPPMSPHKCMNDCLAAFLDALDFNGNE